jgi:catechol 2,3-dioxygenase-like lactoylglutathione lyase family enzyme
VIIGHAAGRSGYRRDVLIRHLALTVRDPEASADFYLSVVGLDGRARREPWGRRVDLADGFMLALIRGEPSPVAAADTVHFGCLLSGRDEALQVRARLRQAGVAEVEWEDAEDYVGVKVEDPDGYIVELAFDLASPGLERSGYTS